MEKLIKRIELGNILIQSGEVVISDPCYNTDIWCLGIEQVKKGEYICSADLYDFGDWGKRIGKIRINHIDNPKCRATRPLDETIGVDSGQAGFFEKNYYEKYHKKYYVDEDKEDDAWYRRVCDITLDKPNCGTIDNAGCVSESGCGDGGYWLRAGYNSKGEIVALEIDFR